jgi:hypothetical protein
MRILRGLGGALLWLLASVIGLVAAILCVTVILLPLGLPLLGVARRMFGTAVQLLLPKPVAHPMASVKDSVAEAGSKVGSELSDTPKQLRKKSRELPFRKRRKLSLG